MTREQTELDAMAVALDEARLAMKTGDIPVGAVVLLPDGSIIGRGRNLREAHKDPSAHAEIVALRQAAGRLGRWRLDDCTLVSTLEPCVMCAGAIVEARVPRLIFGAWDEKAGACGSLRDVVRDARLGVPPEVLAGLCEAESAELLAGFFAGKRGV